MFDLRDVAADEPVACAEVLRVSVEQTRRLAAQRLRAVARWLELHPVPGAGEEFVGPRPSAVRPGGHGTPAVTQVAVVELGVLLELTTVAASRLVGEVLDLVHRHPRWWEAVQAGRVPDYVARSLVRLTARAGLTLEQARWVDAETVEALVGLPWGRAQQVVEAKILAADPRAAQQRQHEEATRRYVVTSRPDPATGMRTLKARTTAAEVMRVEAMVDHLAGLLAAAGDPDPSQLRRAKALTLLADPARACLLLADRPTDPTPDPEPEPAGRSREEPEPPVQIDPVTGEPLPADPAGAGGPRPRTVVDAAAEVGRLLHALGPTALRRLRPRTVLYLHLAEEALRHPAPCPTGTLTGTGAGAGAADPITCLDPGCGHDTFACPEITRPDPTALARAEGHGPLGLTQLRDWLGTDQVVVRPVLDPLGQTPVDSYEIPTRLREATQILHPYEVFPYGTLPARTADLDHTRPYLPRTDGGPPGQTRPDNLGPLGRTHHRAKTHGRFHCHQPLPGLFLWRTPTGHWYRVDHTGTHPLGRHTPALIDQQRQPRLSPMESHLATLLLTA